MRAALLLLAICAAPLGCVRTQVMVTDVRPGPRGSLIVSRCTLQTQWIVVESTGWYDCKENIVRAAYDEPAAVKAAPEQSK